MDDMAKIIKELSNKISKMELDQANPYSFSRRDFKRNPNPQTQQRPVKNEDSKIKAPFKTKNFMQSDDTQDFEGFDEDIDNLSDNDQEPHLTRQDYKRYLYREQLFGSEVSMNNMGESDYQGIIDSIMAEIQQKYNLRPRDKISTIDPPKKILSRSKNNETSQTSTKDLTAKKKHFRHEIPRQRRSKLKQHKPIELKKETQRSHPEKPKRPLGVSI
jgi:hypothetical protein